MRWYFLPVIYLIVACLLSVPFLPPFDQPFIPGLPSQPIGGPDLGRLGTAIHGIIHSMSAWRAYALGVWFIFAGVVAYTLRCRQLLIYGLLELLAAFVLVDTAILDVADNRLSLAILLQLLSGAYVAVRALDNIENGLTAAGLTTAHAKWRWFFFG